MATSVQMGACTGVIFAEVIEKSMDFHNMPLLVS